MIGSLLERIRLNKNISKTDLAQSAGINIGHLTHIEKEERNPSYKTLKLLCDGLDVPYWPLMHTYEKKLTDEQKDYDAVKCVKYDAIPVYNSLRGFTPCPSNIRNATFVLKAFEDSMSPRIGINDYLYIEPNVPLSNHDYGIFQYDGVFMIRRFIIRKNDVVLRSNSDDIKDIVLTKNDSFYIIGKILGKNNERFTNFVAF